MYAKTLPRTPAYEYPYQEQERCSGSSATAGNRTASSTPRLTQEQLDRLEKALLALN